MKIKQHVKVIIACILTTASIYATAEVKEIFRDDFDNYNARNWGGEKPSGAEIIFRNTLSSTNGALRLNPQTGACYFISQELYRKASMEIEFKAARFSDNGLLYYYIGFHNTQPWAQDLSWLVIQDNCLKFQGLKDGSKKAFDKIIAYLEPEKWYRLEINREENRVTILLNGEKKLALEDKNFIPDAPMSVFIGANGLDKNKSPDIVIDYVSVKGNDQSSKETERTLSDNEIRLLKLQQNVAAGNWKGSINNGEIHLETPNELLIFSFKHGLQWIRLENKNKKSFNFIGKDKSSPVFAIKVDNKYFKSQDIPIEKIEFTPDQKRLNIIQSDSRTGIKTLLSITQSDSTDVIMNLSITNQKNTSRNIRTIFPLLNELGDAESKDEMSYFFPWRGGLLGKVSCSLAAEYGAMVNMQIMAVFDNKSNSGLLVIPQDVTGGIKGFMMQKNDLANGFKVKHHEIWFPDEMLPASLVSGEGIGMATYSFSRDIKAGEKLDAIPVRMSIISGNWREALKKYVAWTKTWYKPNITPQWFQDCFTFICEHPASYYSEDLKKYIGAEKLIGGEHITQWAFWEESKTIPKEARTEAFSHYQPGDFIPEPKRGGMKSFKEEIQRYKEKGAEFSVYTNFRFCWNDSEIGKKHGLEWASISLPGGSYASAVFPKEIYCMCFYDTENWPQYLAETFRNLIKESGIKSIYIDELGVQMPCYNPAHPHFKQGEYPTSSPRVANGLKLIRDYMKKADPEAALMTEHPGSDWLTQYVDGAWDETFYSGAFPFVEKYYDDNRLCYFRFCFPSFKQAEWGSSLHHVNRSFFNGMGWDFNGGDHNVSRVLGQVLKENGNAISSLNPEPLIATSNPELLANRFPAADKIIYTVYNKGIKTVTGKILEVPALKGHYVELVNDTELKNGAELTVPAETVRGVALLPEAMIVSLNNGKVNIAVKMPYDKFRLTAYPQVDDSHLNTSKGVSLDLKNGKCEVSVAERFGKNCDKLILKLMDGPYLIDERVLAAE